MALARSASRKLTILHTNDMHGHLAPWLGWEGELKGKTIGGLGVLAGAIEAARPKLAIVYCSMREISLATR